MLDLLWNDLRTAVRSLRKQPRFTALASLTLSLGIGAVASIFSVVNGVLLQPLPFPHADRLVNVWSTAPALGYPQFPLSPDLFFFFEAHNQVFEDSAMFESRRLNLNDGGDPDVIDARATTHRFFSTLGVTPALGRAYRADEDQPGAPRVVVVSHRFWMRRYGGDPSLLGRTIRLDGDPTEVIGITPAWFDEAGSPDLFVPARFDPDDLPAGSFGWNAVARLRPGVQPQDAVRNLQPLVARATETIASSPNYRAFLIDGGYRPLVHHMRDDVVGGVREPLWILLGTVTMVLLVACANVANLCLIRADGRQREIAVRIALGAGRRALVRQLLVEALVLAFLGSAIGLAVSAAALPTLLALAPSTIPRLDLVGLDLTVVLVTSAVAVVSALLFGLVPALRYTRPQALGAIRQGGRTGVDAKRIRGRNVLVVAQTAIALVLLVGSGLLARSFSRLTDTELGFDSRNVLTFRLTLPATAYSEPQHLLNFQRELSGRLANLPGVEAAGAVSVLPIASGAPGSGHDVDGHRIEQGQLPPIIHYKTVSPGYFAAMRIPLLLGRDFDSSDAREDVRHVVVNKSLADQYWPGEHPIGKRLRPARGGDEGPLPWFTVIGLVGSVRQDGLRQPQRPLIYYGSHPTAANGASRVMTYVVRGPEVERRADAVRQAVWSLDRNLPIAAVQTLDAVVENSIVQFRFTMVTLGIAGALALALGAIGLYGVLAYSVTLRAREIGVRLALGAPPARVMRSVVASGAGVTVLGLLLGIAGAAGLTRFLEGLLYETEPLDIGTFAGMSAALLLVALLASYLPARKAAAVSPMESMKGE